MTPAERAIKRQKLIDDYDRLKERVREYYERWLRGATSEQERGPHDTR